MPLYPLKFHPRFVPKMWGGRKLHTVLGKSLPPEVPIGESWELYDFPPGLIENSPDWVSSVVANGPWAGRTLHALLEEFGPAIHGAVPLGAGGQFPILIKFLDAREHLSVQVHPDAAYCQTHPDAHLKSEAWYVLENDPGAFLFKGLKPGTSREQFQKAIEAGTVEQLIHQVPARPGDCHYLPSGTVHALGAGILVAEVQTPSDTTFRVYDFNRPDPSTGKPRQLHVEQALACIDFSGAPEPKQVRSHVGGMFTTVTRLCTSDYFKIEKVRFTEGVEEPVPYDQPVLWMMLEGQAEVRVADVSDPTRITKGDTVLLPAQMNAPILKTLTDCIWLEVTFPIAPEVG
jgi:mannose-6-phosphate isomerase